MIKIIDLSRDVSETTYIVQESSGYSDPPIVFEPWCTVEEKGYAVTFLHMGVHAGTHCDMSSHYVTGGKSITDVAMGNFVAWALTFDPNQSGPVGANQIELMRQRMCHRRDCAIVLRNGTDSPLTIEARRALVSLAPKFLIAGPGFNIDEHYYDSDFFHRAEIPLIMNPDYDRLKQVIDGDLLVAAPMKLLDLEAAPVRLFAIRMPGSKLDIVNQ